MQVELIEKDHKTQISRGDDFLREIEELDNSLNQYFSDALIIDDALTRKLVSFQANKTRAYYRWYKYKEAFSAELVEYLFRSYNVIQGKILDPFAGVGTALFASSSLGYDSEGIEVLPVGQKIINANILARSTNKQSIISGLEKWVFQKPWNAKGKIKDFEVLRITDGAYSSETQKKIGRYLNDLDHESIETKEILLFALLCILE